MATTVRSGAIYGIGTYGVSRYGVSNVAYTPDGVAGVATSDSGVVITGDANHVVVSLVSPTIVGSVGVVGVAVTNVTGVQASALLNDNVSFSLGCRFSVNGVAATGVVGTTTVVAKATTLLSGVSATGFVDSLTIAADANTDLTGVEASFSIGEVDVRSINRIPVDGIVATGAVGDMVVVADANTLLTGIATQALLGSELLQPITFMNSSV
jgi:hypothetical protein